MLINAMLYIWNVKAMRVFTKSLCAYGLVLGSSTAGCDRSIHHFEISKDNKPFVPSAV